MATATVTKRPKKMTDEELLKEQKKTWYKKLLEVFRIMGWCDEAAMILAEQTRKRKVTDLASAYEYMLKIRPRRYLEVYDELAERGFCRRVPKAFDTAYGEQPVTDKRIRALLKKFKIKIKDVPLKALQKKWK